MGTEPNDTIVALSSPPGRGGVALIRLSGPATTAVATALGVESGDDRTTTLAVIRAPDGEPIDRALATRFRGPASYTGEDVLEISCHGGALVPALIIDAACAAGARMAEPGEFTRRAYLNGKLDLIQAEATLDLIDATSVQHHRAALQQLQGTLSGRVDALRAQLLDLRAVVGYDIDFPEEDDGPIRSERILSMAAALSEELGVLLEHAPEAERLRDGVLTVIAGPPNVGKSTLFNELQGVERAIVTDTPGTTRDAIEADVSIKGFPFRLVDTAGIRDEAEPIERRGIEIARGYLERADVVLVCVESGGAVTDQDRAVATEASVSGAQVLWVRTKVDEPGPEEGDVDGEPWISVSARRSDGLAELRDALVATCFKGLRASAEPALVTHRRHARALEAARREVDQFADAIRQGHPSEIATTHLEQATVELEGLLGTVDVEDVLDVIFGRFCVGK